MCGWVVGAFLCAWAIWRGGGDWVVRVYADLEIIVGFHFSSEDIHLLVIDLLDLSHTVTHLILPELAVLRRRVPVGECGQLLHLLVMDRL